jgi:tRNA A-37 threonylcarbamoyl transferase component Bud32
MTDLINRRLGQYQLIQVIGHGGMSTVYKAYQDTLDRNIAVKVLLHTRDPQFASRFKREARAVARLQHHNILPIHDYGEQDGLLYLVMQYIEDGVTLGHMLGTPMAPVKALRLIGHLLSALDYAHKRGVVHRDIKPANILMSAPDWPMLADFGIAKLLNDDQRITMSGLVIGTAAYMAPEQARGLPIDARTDIYSVGVVLFEMLVGRVPFEAETPLAVLMKQINEAPPLLRRFISDIPAVVETLLSRALAKDPSDRYQSAAEMAADLQRIVNELDASYTPDQLVMLYQTGVWALREGRWDLAIERLGKLVAFDPTYEDGRELLDAAIEFQRAAQDEPSDLLPKLTAEGYARDLQRQGQQKERAEDLDGALADYQAAQAAAPPGGLHDELTIIITDLAKRIERKRTGSLASAHSCPQCGRTVRPGWMSCRHCGASLRNVTAEPYLKPRPEEVKHPAPSEPAPSKRSSMWLWFTIGAGALVVALGAVVGRSGSSTSPTSTPAPTVAMTATAPSMLPSPVSTSTPVPTVTLRPEQPTNIPQPPTNTARPPMRTPRPSPTLTPGG